jgi:hypothetical protein
MNLWGRIQDLIGGVNGSQSTFDTFANTTLANVARYANDVSLGIQGVIDWLGSEEGKTALADFSRGLGAIADAFFSIISNADKALGAINGFTKGANFGAIGGIIGGIVGYNNGSKDTKKSSSNTTNKSSNITINNYGNNQTPQGQNQTKNIMDKYNYLK